MELRARGADVLIVKADAADPKSLADAVAEAQSCFGTINGVVHAAAALDPTPAMHKTRESAERVFGPKVHGAFNLEEIFSESPLDFFIYLSSQASYAPQPGQVDYSAANAVLDALARDRSRRHRGLSCATGWGAWKEVGLAVRQLETKLETGSQPGTGSDGSTPAKDIEDVDHPVFRTRRLQEDGRFVYRGLLHKGQWIVDEHLFKGRSLLSGTTIVELARAGQPR